MVEDLRLVNTTLIILGSSYIPILPALQGGGSTSRIGMYLEGHGGFVSRLVSGITVVMIMIWHIEWLQATNLPDTPRSVSGLGFSCS